MNQPQNPSQPNRTARSREWLIVSMIVLAAMLFMLTAGVLYYRWAQMRDPNGVIVVQANAALRGAEVTVSGIQLADPLTMVVGKDDRFSIPFYVDEGIYTVNIRFAGQELYHSDVQVQRRTGYKIDLTRYQPPATAPSPAGLKPTTPPIP